MEEEPFIGGKPGTFLTVDGVTMRDIDTIYVEESDLSPDGFCMYEARSNQFIGYCSDPYLPDMVSHPMELAYNVKVGRWKVVPKPR